jgi:inner membrane protein
MDVVTQTLIGAVAAQSVMGRRLPRRAWLAGALGGYIPDADIFIRFHGDSLSTWLIHRHFTHGIGFIPIAAALVTLPWLLSRAGRRDTVPLYLAALLGVATHAPLDACTAFGTMLWWPLSHTRVSWDLVAIIDPIVTLPLLVGLLWSLAVGWNSHQQALTDAPGSPPTLRGGVRSFALAALLWVVAYIGIFGALQREAALRITHQLARERGHEPARVRVLLAPGQNFLFRSIYEYGGAVYADSIRTPWWGEPTVWRGAAAPLYRADPADPLARDIARFNDFTQGWTIAFPVRGPEDARTPADTRPAQLADARYGVTPDAFESLWKLNLSPTPPDTTTTLERNMGLAQRRADVLWNAITGKNANFVPLAPEQLQTAPR